MGIDCPVTLCARITLSRVLGTPVIYLLYLLSLVVSEIWGWLDKVSEAAASADEESERGRERERKRESERKRERERDPLFYRYIVILCHCQ